MKPIYQCDWCGERGTEEEIRKHEANCFMNKALRSCYTCGNRKGFGFTRMDCQLDEEIQQLRKIMMPSPSSYRSFIIMPQWWVEKESAARPNDFIFRDDGTITWCGYIVYTYGDKYESN